jgi:DNA-binding GntR family transcriptional regulator
MDKLSREGMAEQIIDLVTRGSLGIGPENKTSENDLGKLLGGEGRTPILREALALLVRDGIVDVRPQSGTFVKPVDTEEASEIWRLRGGVERVVVHELATGSVPFNEELFKPILNKLETANEDDDPATFNAADAYFREQLAAVGGFFNATQSIRAWSNKLRVFECSKHGSNADRRDRMMRFHEQLLGRIGDRDQAGAVGIVEKDVKDALAWIDSPSSSCSAIGPQREHPTVAVVRRS